MPLGSEGRDMPSDHLIRNLPTWPCQIARIYICTRALYAFQPIFRAAPSAIPLLPPHHRLKLTSVNPASTFHLLLLLLLLLLKKVSSARLGDSDIHPMSSKTPAPQYQPIDRKKRKGKRVEDYSRDRAA